MLTPAGFVAAAVRAGAFRGLRKAGFKRPGGGSCLNRWAGLVHQELFLSLTFGKGRPSVLRFSLRRTLAGVFLGRTVALAGPAFDAAHGEPREYAMEVLGWTKAEVLPVVEAPVDLAPWTGELEARAIELERYPPTSGTFALEAARDAWVALGRADDVARVDAALAARLAAMPAPPPRRR